MTNPLESIGQKSRDASLVLAQSSNGQRNAALAVIAEGLTMRADEILRANSEDVAAAKAAGTAEAQLDRLRLTDDRLKAIAKSVLAVRDLPDPLERKLDSLTRPNGLRIEKHSIPLGVIGIIFEARPNVAVDAAVLCLKSGNACILRSGSESWDSVVALVDIIRAALRGAGLPENAVQMPPSASRDYVGALLTLDGHVDLIIPRGGKSLTARVAAESKIPVLGHLDGICHTYIDASADPDKAAAIALNAKMRRTSVCGATECLLLHKNSVKALGTKILSALLDAGCEVRVPDALLVLDERLKSIRPGDYGHEFLAPVIAVAVVDDVKDAVDFVNLYGSGHTDAIIAEDVPAAEYFLKHVRSAIAIHNASTQFADGGEFGKGAEIGIATGRLHARGPVGLEELTTYQYRVFGSGQTRP